jgi:hypothetical protein
MTSLALLLGLACGDPTEEAEDTEDVGAVEQCT